MESSCMKRCGHERVEGILLNDPEWLKKEHLLKKCDKCQALAEEPRISKEIQTVAGMWHSDMAKRATVEGHLRRAGIRDASRKVETLISLGKITELGRHGVPYISLEKNPKGFLEV